MQTEFKQWVYTPNGQLFLNAELKQLNSLYPLLSGSMGLQLSLTECHDFLDEANLSEKIYVLGPEAQTSDKQSESVNAACLRASRSELPFAKSEFAVVAAPHILEVVHDPQSALREIYRVTAPEGHVLITGINPLSLFGLRSKLPFQSNRIKQSFVGLSRLKEWLSLLGFEMVAGNYFHYSGLLSDQQPDQSSKVDDTSKSSFIESSIKKIEKGLEFSGDRWFPAAAGAYAIVARKRSLGGTFVGEKTKKNRRGLVGVKPVINQVDVMRKESSTDK